MPKKAKKIKVNVVPKVVVADEVSVCTNCNKKYQNDGVALCPQCRQV